jgi:hypothetical protein
MRQYEIENAQLRSELRTLARNEDLARVEVSVFERVQAMVSLRAVLRAAAAGK